MADLQEVMALLSVHEKSHAHGGALSNIAAAALAKLKQINAEHVSFGAEEAAMEAETESTESEPTEEEEHTDE